MSRRNRGSEGWNKYRILLWIIVVLGSWGLFVMKFDPRGKGKCYNSTSAKYYPLSKLHDVGKKNDKNKEAVEGQFLLIFSRDHNDYSDKNESEKRDAIKNGDRNWYEAVKKYGIKF